MGIIYVFCPWNFLLGFFLGVCCILLKSGYLGELNWDSSILNLENLKFCFVIGFLFWLLFFLIHLIDSFYGNENQKNKNQSKDKVKAMYPIPKKEMLSKVPSDWTVGKWNRKYFKIPIFLIIN